VLVYNTQLQGAGELGSIGRLYPWCHMLPVGVACHGVGLCVLVNH